MSNSFNSAVFLNVEQTDGKWPIFYLILITKHKITKERGIANKLTEGNKLVKAISAERNYHLRDYEGSFAMKKMITQWWNNIYIFIN